MLRKILTRRVTWTGRVIMSVPTVMIYNYKTKGTCSRSISVELDGDIIKNVNFEGGCAGNLAGISEIVKGMKVEDVIEKFGGIRCGFKSTSCPDQLAKALLEAREAQKAPGAYAD